MQWSIWEVWKMALVFLVGERRLLTSVGWRGHAALPSSIFFFILFLFECVSSAPYIIEGLKNIIMCFFASLDLMEGEWLEWIRCKCTWPRSPPSITLIPHCCTNSKWQPQKNIPCGVSSRSFLDCMIIRSDQMVMSPGMLSEWMLFNHSCWASSF